MVKHLQALAVALAVIAALPGSAQATLIGDEVTITFLETSLSRSVTGTAGVDPLAIVVSASSNTRFDPVFGMSSIEIGFSTDFPGNQWAFGSLNPVLVFSGLDWGGSGFITGATLTETVADGLLTPSDLTFTADSVTLDLTGALFINGETVRIDLIKEDTSPGPSAAVPEPASLLIFGLGLAGLVRIQRGRRSGRVRLQHKSKSSTRTD